MSAQRVPAILGGTPRFAEPHCLTRPRIPDRPSFDALLARIFEARWFTNDGAMVRELEAHLPSWLGGSFCVACCNGTIALQLALRSLDLSGEVITTPFTFPATVHAIEWNGLTPVFCDIDPDTYNLDPEIAAACITSRTSALVPVHVFGSPCDVTALEATAQRARLRVVYDAAHAFGVSHRGRPIGEWGDLAVFSFHATKLFHTAEGGAVVGTRDALARSLRLLRNFGIVSEDEVEGVGLNGKMSEIHAALGLAMLGAIEEEISGRGALSERYDASLAGLQGLRFQRISPETRRNYAYYTIEVDPDCFGVTRDELHAALQTEGIVTRKYLFPLCSRNTAYRDLPSAQPGRLPHAERLADRILSLPLYGEMPACDVDAIGDCIRTLQGSAPRVRAALPGLA